MFQNGTGFFFVKTGSCVAFGISVPADDIAEVVMVLS